MAWRPASRSWSSATSASPIWSSRTPTKEEDGDIEDEDAFSPLQGAPTQFGPAVDDLIVTGATATVGGWSDFSDEGLYEVIVCCRCARLYDVFSLDVNWG